ncbi:DUF3303 family protein [uncultured Jannaschia sp.]|uniref:DUF3303 family protein n=1 Tax=uncultured Jannaschia sp. TaxID=293347 RepID=UPI00261C63A4|nr:DUF3303 family protein [uncultured Jannaschia sp.]
MHLLVHLTPADYDTWKADFDRDMEARMNAGLTLMQLWRDMDGTGVTALFEANNRKKASDWLENERRTGGSLDARFLRTA